MRKRLTAALLLGGHLLLTQALVPTTALAAPPRPATPPPVATSDHALHDGHHDSHGGRDGRDGYHDDHYRCWYHCAERGYDWNGSHGRYSGDRHGYGYDHGPYDRSGNSECWYHDHSGGHRCGYQGRYGAGAGPTP